MLRFFIDDVKLLSTWDREVILGPSSESIDQICRWKTRAVKVGNIGVGGNHPIRIQSMTTTDTKDVRATTEQIMRLVDAGCEIVRITVQGKREAIACEAIKNALVRQGCLVPIVADIHFYPPAAIMVVDFVDKVRVNPGNFVDRPATFKVAEYDEVAYQNELAKIDEVFGVLVDKCLKLKRAMRIGTNHGSLSDRIMNRFGDTPLGMVESAFEFARVCRKRGYHDFIFSMKSSHPRVMVEAYRLLVREMIKLGWNYPLHLGVTEAGAGEDGRVKSAVGIGSLLLDGLGDTIRVSLTEDPLAEIDPCQRLVRFAKSYQVQGMNSSAHPHLKWPQFERRLVKRDPVLHPHGSVFINHHCLDLGQGVARADAVLHLSKRCGVGVLKTTSDPKETLLVKAVEHLDKKADAAWVKDGNPTTWSSLLTCRVRLILLEMTSFALHRGRHFFRWLDESNIDIPVILVGKHDLCREDLLIHSAAELGALLLDGYGEGVLMSDRALAFSLLQACLMRTSKTEFVSCPGCGRTLFDLQEVAKRIRSQTCHLPGVKIAIMGCAVNGIGEMVDADFGYVGSRKGHVDLYVGKTCVERYIPFAEADHRLIELIKAHGSWVEPGEKC